MIYIYIDIGFIEYIGPVYSIKSIINYNNNTYLIVDYKSINKYKYYWVYYTILFIIYNSVSIIIPINLFMYLNILILVEFISSYLNLLTIHYYIILYYIPYYYISDII